MQDYRILIFCKAPIPGQVKTRLQPAYSEIQSAEIHGLLATRTINQAQQLIKQQAKVAKPNISLELWCSPDTAHEFFDSFDGSDGFELVKRVQQGADLGARMAQAFRETNRPSILIGTDCPLLTTEYLLDAIHQLSLCDAVIAPAEDGGYGLIGLQQPNDSLFSDIDWGTHSVYKDTVKKFNASQLNWLALDEIWDVDYPADVDRWRRAFG